MGNSGGRTVVGVLRGDGAVGFTVQSLANRYTSTGGHPIFHDDAGNLTVDKDGYKYFYDYENRVVKIQKPDGFGGWDDVAQMAYDALGRRIRVIDSVASTTTLYYYNPEWQCLAEYSGAGTLQRYFVYGNYIDEPLVMHRQSDGEDYYYGQDHLYSTAVLLDDSGNVAERYEYDAYGTVLVYTEDGDDNDWFMVTRPPQPRQPKATPTPSPAVGSTLSITPPSTTCTTATETTTRNSDGSCNMICTACSHAISIIHLNQPLSIMIT